jgi:hypothetical protein
MTRAATRRARVGWRRTRAAWTRWWSWTGQVRWPNALRCRHAAAPCAAHAPVCHRLHLVLCSMNNYVILLPSDPHLNLELLSLGHKRAGQRATDLRADPIQLAEKLLRSSALQSPFRLAHRRSKSPGLYSRVVCAGFAAALPPLMGCPMGPGFREARVECLAVYSRGQPDPTCL